MTEPGQGYRSSSGAADGIPFGGRTAQSSPLELQPLARAPKLQRCRAHRGGGASHIAP
jgi:hypothetical protein